MNQSHLIDSLRLFFSLFVQNFILTTYNTINNFNRLDYLLLELEMSSTFILQVT